MLGDLFVVMFLTTEEQFNQLSLHLRTLTTDETKAREKEKTKRSSWKSKSIASSEHKEKFLFAKKLRYQTNHISMIRDIFVH